MVVNFDVPSLTAFMLVMSRISAFIFTSPLLSSSSISYKIKVVFCLIFSFLMYSILPPHNHKLINDSHPLFFGIIFEIVTGALLGFVMNLLFMAVNFFAGVAGYQMGMAIVNLYDPQYSQQTPILALFLNMTALLLFFASNMHHFLIIGLHESFHHLTLSPDIWINFDVSKLIAWTSKVFTLGLKMGIPIVGFMFCVEVVLGLTARAVPQMNIFMVGFPIKIGVGLLLFLACLGAFSALFLHLAEGLPDLFMKALRNLACTCHDAGNLQDHCSTQALNPAAFAMGSPPAGVLALRHL